MKKHVGLFLLTILFSLCVILEPTAVFAEEIIKIGATPLPHAEILNVIKDDIKKEGIKLEIIEFTDYVKPNLALNDGEIDANFYQHLPYLENFNVSHGTKLASIGAVHIEPLGFYSEKIKTIDNLKEKALIAIPSDSVNGGRALLLLQEQGLIKLSDKAGLEATELDIVENSKKLRFKAIEAAQLPRVLPDVEGAIINGNYALEAGLNPTEDALLIEGSESPYVNIIAVQEKHKKDKKFRILMKYMCSEKISKFILSKYNGGVVPAF